MNFDAKRKTTRRNVQVEEQLASLAHFMWYKGVFLLHPIISAKAFSVYTAVPVSLLPIPFAPWSTVEAGCSSSSAGSASRGIIPMKKNSTVIIAAQRRL